MSNEQVPIKEFTLTTVIKNYHHLGMYEPMYSEQVEHFNVPWKIYYYREENGLSVYLYCGEPRNEKEWSIEAKLELLVHSSNGNWDRYAQLNIAEFSNRRLTPTYGNKEFVSNNDMHNAYLVRNEVIIEIKAKILRMTGIDEKPKLKCFDDEAAKKSADMIICVDDRQFHVSKLFLANQSTHFSSLVFEKARKYKYNKMKVTLNDIDANAFQTFLEVIYLESTLTDSCIEDVLLLAIKYEARNVTRICEEFLLHSSKLPAKLKIRIGIQYNLENLKKSCIDSLESAADVRAVLGCNDSDDKIKDPQVLHALIHRSLSFR